MKILLVEDSPILQKSLKEGLTNCGMVVDQAYDGLQADHFLATYTYDVVILDIMLPKLSGLELLGRLRRRHDNTSVLVLSAKDEIEDRINGLDCGADDYLIKPFSFDELVSRLKALHRRASGTPRQHGAQICLGGLVMDTENGKVSNADVEIDLTPTEFRLLQLLVTRKGQVFSHEKLINTLYTAQQNVTRNAVEAHVSSLRRKLRCAGLESLVKTRRGFGYFIE